MSQWDDRIRSHRIWSLLQAIGPAIDKALEREGTTETIASLERLRMVIAFVGKRLASADPSLVAPTVVEKLATVLAGLKTKIDAYAVSGDAAQLDSANGDADNALVQLASVPGASPSDDLTTISEAAASYRTTLETHLEETLNLQRKLTERAQATEQRMIALESALSSEQQRLNSLVNEYQSQFSQSQDKRASDFATTQNEQLTKFTTVFNDLQAQFTQAQNTRDTTFSDFQRAASDKLATIIADANTQLSNHDKQYSETLTATATSYEAELAELQKDYADKASEILKLIEKNKADVESLVGVIGNLGVTSGYQKTANGARRMMFLWQGLTSISLIGLISVAILTAFPVLADKVFGLDLIQRETTAAMAEQSGSTTVPAKRSTNTAVGVAESGSDAAFYHGLSTRIFLAITFGIFAGYAGRQASHFMGVERKNRKLALELEALGPFIEPLSSEERSKFRIQVGERSFGVPDGDEGKPKEPDPTSGADLIKSKEFRDFFFDILDDAKAKFRR